VPGYAWSGQGLTDISSAHSARLSRLFSALADFAVRTGIPDFSD
jgi:hypothetical protein